MIETESSLAQGRAWVLDNPQSRPGLPCTPHEPRIEELKRQIRQLEELAASGALPAEQAAASKTAGAGAARAGDAAGRRSDDTGRAPTHAAAATAVAATPRVSRKLLAGMGVFVLALAAAGYARFGTPSAWKGVPVAQTEGRSRPRQRHGPDRGHGGQARRSPQGPTRRRRGLGMLGRSYSALGRYPESVTAFQRVVDMAQGRAGLRRSGRCQGHGGRPRLAGEPAALIAKALELDPKNLKALALAGTIAFDNNDFAKGRAAVGGRHRLGRARQRAGAQPGRRRGRGRLRAPACRPPAPAANAVAAATGASGERRGCNWPRR